MTLSTPIREAGFVYKVKAKPLERLGIFTISDLLFHLPFRYEDYTKSAKIRDLKIGETTTIKGEILDIKNEYTRRRFVLQKAHIKDESGILECLWFNQSYLTRVIHSGNTVGLVGKLEMSGNKAVFQVKDYEVLADKKNIHTSGLVPVYPETYGISSKWLRNRIFDILEKNRDEIVEFLPKSTIKNNSLENLQKALADVHFPQNLEGATKAHERLEFDELLLAHLGALKRREDWRQKKNGIPFQISDFRLQISEFIDLLPFKLTSGQAQAVEEIRHDLSKDTPMNRLLEGDVGSGKTVVAAIAMYIASLNGYQSVLMAPTEILANQHYETLIKFLKPLGLEIALFTSSKKTHKDGFDIAVGTHALIQKNLNFEKLGLVVIDEQQRFGVEQRAILREKGKNPHFLTMTATPIPRTVLLALYKDLDVSLLSEMPRNRKKIKTWLVPNHKRSDGYTWIKKQIEDSNYTDQAFIVCPFIEESENLTTVKAAKIEFERLQKEDLKDLKLGLLHGKMKAKEKDEVLRDFADMKFNVLVATPVVEVGIDFPAATIMVIEAADRFGLSQLHQLRGRVGRGDKQSYCLLFSENENTSVLRRLKHMETANSGFELAELDLKLRGGGNLFGTSQHGFSGLKIADFSNFELVDKAKKEAENILPKLTKLPMLLEKIETLTTQHIKPD